MNSLWRTRKRILSTVLPFQARALTVWLVFLWASPGQAADPALKPTHAVGAARRDITPEYPIRLSGYGSRTNVNTGITQRLYAKALAIGSDAEGPAVLVTVDNCGVPASIRDEVLRRLASKTKVRDERFAIASSHTHCAPMLLGVLPNLFSSDIPPEHLPAIERYTRELTDHIESVALEALKNRRPAQLHWGIGSAGFAANRRAYRLKPTDHDLPVLRVTDASGNVVALLTSYACHCTTLGIDTIHADWAGCAQEALEKAFPGAIALVAIGCGADQNPNPRRTLELAEAHGQAIATEAGRLAQGTLTALQAPVECRTRVIDLAFDRLPSRAEWERLAVSGSKPVAYHARRNLERLDRGESLPTHLPYRVQVWNFGSELAFVFLAGEVVVDYSLRLKATWDPRRLWVNGYANDVPCYIPSRRILDEGGYEGADSMVYYDRPTRFAPDVEERIFDAIQTLLPKAFLRTTVPSPMEKAPAFVLYPDHSNLSVVRSLDGSERPIQNPQDWSERVAHIRAGMQQAMGPLPGVERWAPLDLFVVSEEDAGSYRRLKIRYTPEKGDRVPAWLLVPKDPTGTNRFPAMLCLHQTTPIGKDEPAGLGGSPSLHYAHELAGRGYVCIVPDYPSFGEYPYDFKVQGAGDASGTIKAVYNNQRAIDLLQSLPYVRPDRIGVIGHSLGGHNALFTAALDDRIKATVSSCGFTPFHDYYGGKVAGWTSDRYMPRIRDVYGNNPDKLPFDFYEVIAAIAPRGFFSCSPLHDSNFDIGGVRRAFEKVRPVYKRLEAESRLVLATPDAPHDFPKTERQAAYRWLDSLLQP